MDDHRCRRIGQVDAVDAEVVPDGPVRPEHLVSGEPVAAVDPLGERGRHHDGCIVADLGMSGGEHVAGGGPFEDPAARGVAESFELDGDADPVVVHRHAERGRRRVARERALHVGEGAEVEAPTSELLGDGGGEVADLAQHGEILVEVGVALVGVGGRGPGTRRASLRPEGSDGRADRLGVASVAGRGPVAYSDGCLAIWRQSMVVMVAPSDSV